MSVPALIHNNDASSRYAVANVPAVLKRHLQVLTFQCGAQFLCLETTAIGDVIIPLKIFPVPLTPTEISGVINLRGKIIVVINLQKWLKLKSPENKRKISPQYCITMEEENGDLFGILVDKVGDVIDISLKSVLPAPSTLPGNLRSHVKGVCRTMDNLVLMLHPLSLNSRT